MENGENKMPIDEFTALEKKYNIKYFLQDSILLSYPKSGRTWLRMILAKILDEKGYNTEEYEMLPAFHLSIDDIKKRFGPNINVVFLHRNIGDVLLSHHHERTTSTRSGPKLNNFSIQEFIRDENYGAVSIAKYNVKCFDSLKFFKKSKVITYEDMSQDANSVVKEVASFLGIGATNEEIKNAVEYSDFNNMQKIDQGKGKNYLSNYKGNFGKSPGRVRKGKVNDYLDVLEKEDVDFIKKIQEIQDENMSNG